MKLKNFSLPTILLILALLFSCNKENLFQQPSIKILSISLQDLPKDSAHLNINIELINNDKRSVHLADAQYQADIEGFLSGIQACKIDQDIETDIPLKLSLPLTLATEDAIQLLSMMDKGQTLDYQVTGTFHVDDPFYNLLTFPLDIQGTAEVDLGFEAFFNQPGVVVNEITGTYVIHTTAGIPTGYTFNLNVNTTITNNDSRSAEIDEVEYTPVIEGQTAEKSYYSDTYSNNLVLGAGDSVTLDLPVTLELNNTEGLNFLTALSDGYASYTVKGIFHTVKVDEQATDFNLPLYVEGEVPITVVRTK